MKVEDRHVLMEFTGRFELSQHLDFHDKSIFRLECRNNQYFLYINECEQLEGNAVKLDKPILVCEKERGKVLVRGKVTEKVLFNKAPTFLFENGTHGLGKKIN